jgi:hypothetical protein
MCEVPRNTVAALLVSQNLAQLSTRVYLIGRLLLLGAFLGRETFCDVGSDGLQTDLMIW